MLDDDFYFKIIFILIFIICLFFILFITTLNEAPDKIKDTNCIYYKEKIYCLKEE